MQMSSCTAPNSELLRNIPMTGGYLQSHEWKAVCFRQFLKKKQPLEGKRFSVAKLPWDHAQRVWLSLHHFKLLF